VFRYGGQVPTLPVLPLVPSRCQCPLDRSRGRGWTSYNSTLRFYLFGQLLRFLVFILKALKEGSHEREVPAQPSSKSRHLLFTSSQKENAGGHCALRPKRAGLVGWTLKQSESRNRGAKCPEEPVSLRALPEPSRPSRIKLEMLHCYSLE
jgi:hypothetical protein